MEQLRLDYEKSNNERINLLEKLVKDLSNTHTVVPAPPKPAPVEPKPQQAP